MNRKRAVEILKNMQHQVVDSQAGFSPEEIDGAKEDFNALEFAIRHLEKSSNEKAKELEFNLDAFGGWLIESKAPKVVLDKFREARS